MAVQSYLSLILIVVGGVIAPAQSLSVRQIPASVLISEERSHDGSITLDMRESGNVYQLNLKPLENIWSEKAQIFTIERDQNGETKIEASPVSKYDSKFYHDPNGETIVSVKGGTVKGILKDNISISSLNGKHFVSKVANSDNYEDDYLEVPERPKFPYKEVISDQDYITLPSVEKLSKNLARATTYTVEVAIFVDSALASEIGNNTAIYDYMTVFWNGVNSRYARIEDPKIKIRLIAVVIFRTPAEEPFITNNPYPGGSSDQIDGYKTLEEFSRWAGKEYGKGSLPPFDVGYLMTGKDLVSPSDSSSTLKGCAYLKRACLIYSSKAFNTGIGEDRGAVYSGVHTAAHEIAHLLGAPHDGLSSSGTGSCPWSNGYIMSYQGGSINRLYFSNCSINQMKDYMASASCLTKNIDQTSPPNQLGNTNDLPGSRVSMDDQCKAILGISNARVEPVSDQDSLCYNLRCREIVSATFSKIYTTYIPAAEGSACPRSGRCSNGACV